VPAGTVGELLIRGAGAMTGSNKREKADVFDADGWYHLRRSGQGPVHPVTPPDHVSISPSQGPARAGRDWNEDPA